MEKKQASAKQKKAFLKLRTETLHRLEGPKLRAVVGGARLWRPLGYAEDTTPLYEEVDG
jgi:hypothetical protein